MMKSKVLFSVLLCLASVAVAGVSAAGEGPPGDRSAYKIVSAVVGAAGSAGASATMQTNGTAAQSTPIGVSTNHGKFLYAGFWKSMLILPSGIDPIFVGGFRDALYLNRPNPLSRNTWIPYSLAREGSVELKVFDAAGRAIRMLVSERVSPGIHYAVWDGRDDAGALVASGVYFYRIASEDFVSSRKLMLIR